MTYLSHFALARYPFQTPADPAELFPSKAAAETHSRLQHLLELRGFGLLTGEPGCGKTTACRRFAASLPPGRFRVAYVSLSTGSVLDTYQAIAWEFGLQPERSRAAAYRTLREEFRRLAREAGQLPFLILDEAHNLRNDVLEDLRLPVGFDMDAEPGLCLLLAGCDALRRRLALRVHQSLCQRFAVHCCHDGLARDELQPYLAHRLLLAGCDRDLFAPAAAEPLFEAARGLPRQINRIAHYSLAAAACAGADRVAPEHVAQACAEVRL